MSTLSSCPLDVGMPLPATHIHDPCLCLELHAWDEHGLCTRCAEERCGTVRGLVRCDREREHGRRHFFAKPRASRLT